MSRFKVLALTATLIMATAGLSMACDKGASSASAEGSASSAAVETASAEGCASGAAAQAAGAEGGASTAAVKTAGAGCSATGATAKTAGAHCEGSASAQTVKVETVRMPSGAMAVFYHGTDAETVAYLQSKAAAGCGGFVCGMAKSMAADDHVSTEIAPTETGVMILVTSTDEGVVDGYEAQYAAMTTAGEAQGD